MPPFSQNTKAGRGAVSDKVSLFSPCFPLFLSLSPRSDNYSGVRLRGAARMFVLSVLLFPDNGGVTSRPPPLRTHHTDRQTVARYGSLTPGQQQQQHLAAPGGRGGGPSERLPGLGSRRMLLCWDGRRPAGPRGGLIKTGGNPIQPRRPRPGLFHHQINRSQLQPPLCWAGLSTEDVQVSSVLRLV